MPTNMLNRNDSFRSRLALLIGSEEPFRWAKRIGIPAGTFARMWSEGSIPKHTHLCRIAEETGVSLDWLLTGKGYAGCDRIAGGVGKVSLVPVTGLANCGIKQGWYNESALSYKIAVPSFLKPKDGFAVLCRGNSMVPAGIRDGNICIVSPSDKPKAGESVLIRTKSFIKGKEAELSTIKRFEKVGKDTIRLTGWLDADDSGVQSPFSEERSLSCVTMIAPVRFVLEGIDASELSDSRPKSDIVLDEGIVKDCFEAIEPLYGRIDRETFSKMFGLLYARCNSGEGKALDLVGELMALIKGKQVK